MKVMQKWLGLVQHNYRLIYWSTIALFALIFCSISLVNHYNFRTYAFDLGIFNHAMYDYAHFRFNQATLLLGFVEINNLIADHFSLLHMLFAPLYYLFGSYTLLLVQIIFILIGSWGIRRYISLFINDLWTPFLAQIHFFVSFGVIAAIGFDYHDSVIAACLFPHLLYYAERRDAKGVIVFSILMLLTRVELSIWLIFISIALFIHLRDSKKFIKITIGIALFSLLYFITVIKLIIPEISADGYTQFNFSVLGNDLKEALVFSVSNPFETMSYLFIDQPNSIEDAKYIKRDFYIAFLVSGGFLLLFRPLYLIMLFPVIAQRMLNDSVLKWGISGHYSIESVSILSIGVFHFISQINNAKWRYGLALFLILSSAFVTRYFWQHRHPDWTETVAENFLSRGHYQREFDVAKVHQVLLTIPEDAVVSAQNNLVPHLTSRDKIYLYPYVFDADFIVLNEKFNVYPLPWNDYWSALDSLKTDVNWNLIQFEEYTYVFKRKTSSE